MASRIVSGLVLAAALLATASGALSAERELVRDSGEMAGQRSQAGSGHLVGFEAPKGEWWITGVRIHGARYGGGFDPAKTLFSAGVLGTDLAPLAVVKAPYSLFKPGAYEWVTVKLESPVKAPPSFLAFAAFDPNATKGVFVAWSAGGAGHSSFGMPGGRATPFDRDKEWMIRVVLTDERPPDAPETVELAVDDGERAGELGLDGEGHAVEFRKPSGTWWFSAVRILGRRDGDGPFAVHVTRTNMKPIHRESADRAPLPAEEASWVEVPIRAPVKVPSRFRIVVELDGRVAFSKPGEKRSYTGKPGGRAKRFRKGDWMIRVVLSKEKPEPGSAPAPAVPASAKKDYLADFEFLAKTVKRNFPAFAKKGVDWDAVVREWRPRFKSCKDDADHIRNAARMLAVLNDLHTGITKTGVEAHIPAFDGLYGAGMWIACDGDRIVLRAIEAGHPLSRKLSVGAELLTVEGKPATAAREEVRRQVRTWQGYSSDHCLDAALGNRFFLFGEKSTLKATFRNPDGKTEKVRLPRWGPSGRGFSPRAATMPEGLEAQGKAASTMLDGDVGYIRILGGMNEPTRAAFFDAFDRLKPAKGIVLDCRGMGGGGDGPARAMAGRFFTKARPHGPYTLKPTGDWQFDGPVVMLTDEMEVSSAETFTWAMSESGRVVSVGRPTGGATLIPQSFTVPSGIFSFRLGSTDRRTPEKGVQPEGVGTPPDVLVPVTAALLKEHRDPDLAVGLKVLRLLMDGASRKEAISRALE